MAANHLFVVGSLCEGMIHHSLIANFVREKSICLIPGKILRNKIGYPYLIPSEGAYTRGVVYELEASDMLWTMLDEFHGFNPQFPTESLSQRRELQLNDEAGQLRHVVTYYLNQEKLATQLMDFNKPCWMEAVKTLPPLPERLTERQRTYIKKLGASSGRDIVPIDLTLYRELMGLELIVDKGRRLALSGLGKEVYKYIGANS